MLHSVPTATTDDCQCCICKKYSQDQQSKIIKSKTVKSFLNAAALRRSLKTEKYRVITVNALTLSACCYESYTAIKPIQIPTAKCNEEPVFKKVIRSDSSLPISDHLDLLKETCIFCGLNRKKQKGREEKL